MTKANSVSSWLGNLEQVTQPLWTFFLICKMGGKAVLLHRFLWGSNELIFLEQDLTIVSFL